MSEMLARTLPGEVLGRGRGVLQPAAAPTRILPPAPEKTAGSPRACRQCLGRMVPRIVPLEKQLEDSERSQWDSTAPAAGSVTAMGTDDPMTYPPELTA